MKYTYVIASYVKFLETGGARVIPIPYFADQKTLKHLFESVNGILFTGGSIDLDINTPLPNRNESFNLYTSAANYLYSLAMEANDKGDYFPIWGTCQGFQLLHYLAAGFKNDVLEYVGGEEQANRSGIIDENTKLFKTMDKNLLHYARHDSPFF